MTQVTSILFQTILPILLIAGAGFVLQRRLALDTRSVSRLSLYVLSPCLGFSTIAQSKVPRDAFWRMSALSALVIAAMVAVGLLIAVLLRYERSERSALQLTLAFDNSGNFGLSVCLLAFGDAGLSLGMIYFITSSLMANSLGVYLASRGGKVGSVAASLRNVISMPVLYAAVLGLVVNFGNVSVPAPIMKAADLAGKAAVPTMLLVLGMQLARSPLGHNLRLISIGTVARLLISPLIAALFAGLLRMTGVAWQVALVESAMPTAVTTVILSEEFGASTELASGMVLVTTMFSVITLTGLLALIS